MKDQELEKLLDQKTITMKDSIMFLKNMKKRKKQLGNGLSLIKKERKIKNKHEKIGDKNIKNGNTPLIRINIGSNKYVINADSKKEGVIIFLKNKNNPWILIQNENGLKNKITNNLTEEPIQGFYIYKL